MADTLAQVQKDVRFWQRLLTFAGYKPGKVIAPRCWFMHKAEQPPVFEDSPWIVL